MESEHLCNKQGLKLVLSDAVAVQFEGLRVSRSKGFKSQGCFGISKNVLGSKKYFGISKNVLGSQKKGEILDTVEAIWSNFRLN